MGDPNSPVDRGPIDVAAEARVAIDWLQELRRTVGRLPDVEARIEYLRSRFGQRRGQRGSPRNCGDQTESFNQLCSTWERLGDGDEERRIVKKMTEMLKPIVEEKCGKETSEMTVMHLAAFVGVPAWMEMLAERHGFLHLINDRNFEGQTPLHLASLTGSLGAVKFLTAQEILRADLEDKSGQTAFEIADEVGWHEIVKVLLTRVDVADYLSKRRAERTLYGDGTNAILVGAALIASITFAGWLQPPLGYQAYYQYPRNATMPGAPAGEFQQYAAIAEHLSLKIFWVTNSLSFYFAIAAILAGAGAMVPRRGLGELAEVKRTRAAAYWTGFVFSWAVVFVVVAFTAAGFASLPPGFTYGSYMASTLVAGCLVCIHSFSSVRMSDPSFFLRYFEYVHPAWYISNLSKLFERCSRPFGYKSFEWRTQERKFIYNPDSNQGSSQGGDASNPGPPRPSQGGCVPLVIPQCCRWQELDP